MMLFLFLLLIILINYIFIISLFVLYFPKEKKHKDINTNVFTTFDIVIVFKNEADNIPRLLKSISNINYPKTKYSVLWIDDNSDDESCKIINNFAQMNCIDNFKIYSLHRVNKISAKLTAYKTFYNEFKNKYILFLDADCEVKENFLISIDAQISKTKPSILLNPLIIKDSNSMFSKLQAIEFSSLMASTISACQMQKPIMANGANMCVEKEFLKNYIDSVENKQIQHGDDMYMLDLAIHLKKKIDFNFDFEAIVNTLPKITVKDFVHQRTRWASKSALYKSFFINYIAISVLLTSIAFIALLLSSFFIMNFYQLLMIFMVAKFTVDGILIFKQLQFEKREYLFFYAFIIQFIYPLYIVFVISLSIFRRNSNKWK